MTTEDGGELVSKNFSGRYKRGEATTSQRGHLLVESRSVAHSPVRQFFQCVRRLTPSMNCLTSIPESVPWYVARLVSSAAELEGRAVTMSETSDHSQRYRPEGDPRPVRVVTEEEIRGACNRLMLNGINTITSYYSFGGLDNVQMNRLNDWIGRCCTLLRGGRQAADIALLYPVESAWVRFTPATRWVAGSPPEAHRVEEIFHDAEKDLYLSRRDFTHVDARTLAEARVEAGALCFRDLRWRVVILPDTDTLPLAAWENLEHFYRGGGRVIALTALPANSETEFPSSRVREIGGALFGDGQNPSVTVNDAGGAGVFLPRGSEALLPVVLNALLEHDGNVSDDNAPLRVTHRVINGTHVYFLINDGGQPWEGTVDIPAFGALEQYEPATGQIIPLESGQGLKIRLEAYGGVLYRFKEAVSPLLKEIPQGNIPGLSLLTLPEVSPGLSQGQFVNGSITVDAEQSTPERYGTRQFTKGAVDTFLFPCWYPHPD